MIIDTLKKWRGALIMITHDRYFLDRTMKRIFAFEEDGKLRQYEGGYTDYAIRKAEENESEEITTKNIIKTETAAKEKKQRPRGSQKLKFTYKEQKDYEMIEDEIASMESELETIDNISSSRTSCRIYGYMMNL